MTYTLNKKKKKNPDYFLEGKDESSVWSSALQSEPLLELHRKEEQRTEEGIPFGYCDGC